MRATVNAYMSAFGFLRKHKLSWFLWFPFIITLIVFYGGFSVTSYFTELLTAYTEGWLDSADWLPDWLSWITDVFYWIIWLALRVILYFAFAFLGGSIILLLMAPILTWLSEKVAQAVGKDVPDFSATQFMRDLTRAAALAIRNGAIQLVLTIGCFILGFVPVIGIASAALLFGINAYFYGYNFMDYTLERKRFSVKQSNQFVSNNKFTAMALGTPYALWMLIPFVGPMTSGFVAIYATIAATLVLEEENKPVVRS